MTGGRPVVLIQVAIIIAAMVWLLLDPYAVQLVSSMLAGVPRQNPLQTLQTTIEIAGQTRVIIVLSVVVLMIALLLVDLRTLLARSDRRMTLRRLLFTTALIAAWCGLVVSYERIAWEGKRIRTQPRLSALDRLAERLQRDWPTKDGEIEGLGPFTAYPFSRPSLLLLLTPYPLDGTSTVIVAIERSNEGVLRFQLGGRDGGDWVEWHRAGRLPQSFSGGLSDHHGLKQYARLRDTWYLVRYLPE